MKTELSFESHRIQADILSFVSDFTSGEVLIEDIAKATGADKEITLNGLRELEESGIGRLGRKYYRLQELPDLILPPLILTGLKSRYMGHRIFAYKSIGSTNDTAKRLAESDSPEGTLVVAEKQTKGRGRLGRSWHSPQDTGLYFSLILRPRISLVKMPAMSLVAALSICGAIEKMTGLKPRIKWPNDCLINGKKVAGILVDISAELGRVVYAILGIGININADPKDFPSALRKKATSLAIECSGTLRRIDFFKILLAEIEKSYGNFCRYGFEVMAPELINRSSVIGEKITYSFSGKKESGIALGYDENGALRVKNGNAIKVLSGGEVTLRKKR